MKNINRKLSFARVADAATSIARTNRVMVRFEMGPKEHRQTFVAGPRKSVSTLCWEWAKSVPGMMIAKAQRATKQTKANKAIMASGLGV